MSLVSRANLVFVVGTLAAAATGRPASAAIVVASDTAANYALYQGMNGANGGTGFAPWSVTSTGPATNGGGFVNGASYDTAGLPGQIFDVFENGNGSLGSGVTTATRPFATPLLAGETFSFKDVLHYANQPTAPATAPVSSLGFSMVTAAGTPLVTFAVSGGGAGYALTDANRSAEIETSVGYNYQSTYTFAYTSVDALGDYSLTVTGGSLAAAGVTFTGQTTTGGLPAGFAVVNNDGGYQSDIGFGQLQITAVPEPTTAALGLGATVGLLVRRRRPVA